jgi:hypothetical protein
VKLHKEKVARQAEGVFSSDDSEDMLGYFN